MEAIAAPANSVHPLTRAAWRDWLAENHTRAEGVWLITFKVATGKPRVDYNDAVEEALCFGWIDSKPNKLDDERSMLWFAPRKAASGWARPNKERVARLLAAGQMMSAGLEKVAQAQADGSWYALDAVEAGVIPDDLMAALQANPPAADNFEQFPRSAKRGILEWIQSAKTANTRNKRITETAELAAQNIRANQWRGRKLQG